MAKKISEKELNNVSGGCGGGDKEDKYEVELINYDYNDQLIDYWGILKENSNTEKGIKEIRDKECKLRFQNNKNIKYIEYMIIKNSHGSTTGTIYRQ